MILVTVGAQMPFDRLVHTVDRWAWQRGRADVFAQVGATHSPPRHIAWARFLNPAAFRAKTCHADVIVAHAGIGCILAAMEFRTPILVLPRRADLGETRNDHQIATVREFAKQGIVNVAYDETELLERLDVLPTLVVPPPLPPRASDELIDTLRAFIAGDRAPDVAGGAPPAVGGRGSRRAGM